MRFCGVVPFAVAQDGAACLLLAREAYGRDKQLWSAFAGRVDATEADVDPETIAAREAHEESMGMLGSAADLASALRVHAVRMDVAAGVHFLLALPFDGDLPQRFANLRARALAAAPSPDHYSPFLEKDQVAWVRVDRVRRSGLRYRRGFWLDLDRVCKGVVEHAARVVVPLVSPPRPPPLPPLPPGPDPFATPPTSTSLEARLSVQRG
jgi:predicted NUDIX family NTP pyrophosphohydrolase